MACKTETRIVGEHEYAITQWGATKAMVMKLKLGKFLGGLAEVITRDSANMATTLMRRLGDILERVNPDEFVDFIKEVACSAGRDGEKMSKARFDEYFSGNIQEAYEVAFAVLEVNYSDFLASVLSSLNGRFS